ncbi:MAG: manganese catalase family protein [Oscillospiraceae bacterium]|nr:manganese catalase family protein [Oscillospiraceae bacterium]
MWKYEKKLQYPVKIKKPDARMAQVIISQLGGPDGELAASLRYLNQRYAMPYSEVTGLLTDIGTEELAHVEMISAMLYQLTKDLSIDEIKKAGFDKYFVDHTLGIYPQSAAGVPFTAAYFQSKGDPITDLTENMAAEQKARSTYDNILRLADDPDVKDAIRFLRQREIVHFQRFGEGLRIVQDNLNAKNFYACNPAFNRNCGRKTRM